MKNYKKIVAMALAVLVMLNFVACGEKNTNELESTPDAIVSDGVEDSVVTEDADSSDKTEEEKLPDETLAEFAEEQLGSDSVIFKEKLGRTFGTVSTGDNFASEFNEEYDYAWMEFEDNVNGNAVAARIMRLTDDMEATDVWVHVSLDWENAVDEIIYENVTAKVLREDDTIVACWLDEAAGYGYGIAVIGETLELEQYVSEIFYP